MKRLFLVILIALTGMFWANAQKFVIDPLHSDSVKIYDEVIKKDTVWTSVNNKRPTSICLHKGFEFEALDYCEKGAIILYEGKLYAVYHDYVKFSNNNPDGIENPIPEKYQKRHSAIAKFYNGFSAAITMLLLFALTAIIAFIYIKSRIPVLRKPALIAIPASILAVSIIEIIGYSIVGDDMFWWCDYDYLGFFGSLLCLIPFGAAVAFQLYSIKLYEKVIFDDDCGKKISIKPAAWSIAACIPVLIIMMIIWTQVLDWKQGFLFEAVMLLSFFATLGIGLFITAKKNIATLGFFNGILITIFAVVYIIGCIMSVCAVIALIFRILLQILIAIGVIFMIMMLGTKRRFRGSDGRIYEEI